MFLHICTFAPPLCMDIVAVFTHPRCHYMKKLVGNWFRCDYRKYSWQIMNVLVWGQMVFESLSGDVILPLGFSVISAL